jgi:hypothetical protein
MKSNFKALLVSVFTILLLGISLFGSTVPVAAAQAKSDIKLSYEIRTDRQGKETLVLIATLKRGDGYPLSERQVSFFESVDLFGPARLTLGSATTSAVGIAPIVYETREAGEHKFTVLYSGDDTTEFAMADVTLDLQNLPALSPLEKPVGMEKINYWAMLSVGALVLVVWSLLAGVFFGTIVGIRRDSKG